MLKHIQEVYDAVRSSSSKDKQADWRSVESRLKEQFPLRASSCVQVASKMTSHYKVSSLILPNQNNFDAGESCAGSSVFIQKRKGNIYSCCNLPVKLFLTVLML